MRALSRARAAAARAATSSSGEEEAAEEAAVYSRRARAGAARGHHGVDPKLQQQEQQRQEAEEEEEPGASRDSAEPEGSGAAGLEDWEEADLARMSPDSQKRERRRIANRDCARRIRQRKTVSEACAGAGAVAAPEDSIEGANPFGRRQSVCMPARPSSRHLQTQNPLHVRTLHLQELLSELGTAAQGLQADNSRLQATLAGVRL